MGKFKHVVSQMMTNRFVAILRRKDWVLRHNTYNNLSCGPLAPSKNMLHLAGQVRAAMGPDELLHGQAGPPVVHKDTVIPLYNKGMQTTLHWFWKSKGIVKSKHGIKLRFRRDVQLTLHSFFCCKLK